MNGDLHPYDTIYNALLNQERIGIDWECGVLAILHDASLPEHTLVPRNMPVDAVKLVLQAYTDANRIKPDKVKETIKKWLEDVKEHLDAAVSYKRINTT